MDNECCAAPCRFREYCECPPKEATSREKSTTVYVDEIREYPKQWCHMWCDGDLSELHAMADTIGLKRSWFQEKNFRFLHYDLTPSKRTLALQNGAVFMPLKQWIMQTKS